MNVRAAAFHSLHRGPEPLVLPNAWDFATGAALVEAGFPAIGTTSLGVAVSAGVPDGAGVARAETVALAAKLVRLPCPVSVDVEGGFSTDPAAVADLAAELAELGVAGVNLEDGRPGGAGLVPIREQLRTVAAVRAAAPALFLNARTDTCWLGVDEGATTERARAYADAGADGVFVPALPAGRIAELVAAVDVPVNVLHTPAGPDPVRLAELGVRRLSTGSWLFRAALAATVRTAQAVRDGVPPPVCPPGYAWAQALVPADGPG